LAETEISDTSNPYYITVGMAPALEKPEITSRHKTFIPYCCKIFGNEINDFVEISTYRYGQLYVPISCVESEIQFQRTAIEWRKLFQPERKNSWGSVSLGRQELFWN